MLDFWKKYTPKIIILHNESSYIMVYWNKNEVARIAKLNLDSAKKRLKVRIPWNVSGACQVSLEIWTFNAEKNNAKFTLRTFKICKIYIWKMIAISQCSSLDYSVPCPGRDPALDLCQLQVEVILGPSGWASDSKRLMVMPPFKLCFLLSASRV